ncbi:MAG: hypothetical protein QXO99_01490 [Candidatus Methanomethylicia archaeon]
MVTLQELIFVWTAVFVSFGCLSYLYRENPLFRFVEHLYVGISVGYGVSYDLWFFQNYLYNPVVYRGRWDFVFPWALIGLCYYFFFSRKYFWLYRIPIAIGIGYGLGTGLRGTIRSDFISQINAAIGTSLFAADPFTTFNRFVLFFGAVLAIFFFIFTTELKGPLKNLNKAGRYVILAALGAAFANTVMGRESLLIQRFQLLLGSRYFPWKASGIGTPESGVYAPIMTAICCLGLLYIIYTDYKKKKAAMKPATIPASN